MANGFKFPSNRTFGVEIECVGLSETSACAALRAAGLKAEQSAHSSNVWSVKQDCSVNDRETHLSSCEVVSPILKGRAGLKAVATAARALREAGAFANASCGLHVHIGAKGMSRDHILSIVRRYANFEPSIDRMMPRARRNSQYAHSLNSLIEHYGQSLATTVTALMLGNVPGSRYYRINLVALQRHGTIEFRQHEGTVDADTITNWVLFLLNFVEASKPAARRGRPRVNPVRVPRARKTVSKRELGLAKVVRCLADSPGLFVSTARLSQVSGYSERSMAVCMTEIRNSWNLRIQGRHGGFRLGLSDVRQAENRIRTLESAAQFERDASRLQAITATAPSTFSWTEGRVENSGLDIDLTLSMFKGLPMGLKAFYRERMSVFA